MEKTEEASQNKPRTIAFYSNNVLSAAFTSAFLSGMTRYIQKFRNMSIQDISSMSLADIDLGAYDGIAVSINRHDEFEFLRASGIPVVLLHGECPDDLDIAAVDTDNGKVGSMAAEWFLRRGFRKLAYCGLTGLPTSDMIGRSFAESAAMAGVDSFVYDESSILNLEPVHERNIETLQRGLEKWIPTLPARTGVLCMHDFRANALLQACLRLGRAVPGDIALMGVGNTTSICSCSTVTISSVEADLPAIGEAAMRLMDDILSHPQEAKIRPTVLLPPLGVVERESTAVYPVDPPYLAKALQAMNANLGSPVSISKLAEAAGVSTTTLQAAFRKEFGMSAGKYLMDLRMREARRLVETGAFSMKEVASRTGFSSQSHFSQTYRKFYGHPPIDDTSAGD